MAEWTAGLGEAGKLMAENAAQLYNAQAVLYLTLPKGYSEWSLYDLGALGNMIVLAATDRGIGSMTAYQFIKYPQMLRQHATINDEVGLAVNQSGITRDQIFVTSKTQTFGYTSTARGIDASLQRANLDYFDLMIIHWPTVDNLGTYQALEEAYQAGKLRAIGLSNFNSSKVQSLIDQADIVPMVDQVETNIDWQQKKLHQFLSQNEILHESWAPLGEGLSPILRDPIITEIASRHQKSSAQIILRFLTQQQVMVIPKSTNPEHIAANLDVFDFFLTAEGLQTISNLDHGYSAIDWPASMAEEAY